MGFPNFAFQTELSGEAPVTLKVLQDFVSQLQGYLAKEHNADGGHTNITAQGMQLTTQPALPGSDVLTIAGGDAWEMAVVGTMYLERQGKHVVRVTAAASFPTITAVADNSSTTAAAGELFIAVNASETTIQIKHDTGGYFAHQRIMTPGQTTYSWAGQQTLWFWYDFESQRWRFTGETLGGGDHFNTTISGTVSLPRSGKQVVRITSATSFPTVTAVADDAGTTGSPGEIFIAINASSTTIRILHDTGGASAAQRIMTPGQTTYFWVGQQMLWFWYDSTDSRWRFTGDTFGGGDHFNTSISGTTTLARGGKQVVRVTSAASTPKINAVADDASTTGTPGEMFISVNTAGTTVEILNNSAGIAAQGILTPGQVTYSWVGQQMLWWWYDSTSSRWRFTGEYNASTGASVPTGGIACMLFTTPCPSGWTTIGTSGSFVRIGTFGNTGGANTHSHSVSGSIDASASFTGGSASGTYDNHQHHVTATSNSMAFITVDAHVLGFHNVEKGFSDTVDVVEDFDPDHFVNDIGHTHDDWLTDTDGGGSISVSVDDVTMDVTIDSISLGTDTQDNIPVYQEFYLCSAN